MKGRKGRRCFISSVEICSRFRLTNHRILESRASNYHLPIKKLKSCIGPSKKGCSSRWTELDYRKSSRRCRPFRERERLWAREREKKGGNKGKESRVGRGERGGGNAEEAMVPRGSKMSWGISLKEQSTTSRQGQLQFSN